MILDRKEFNKSYKKNVSTRNFFGPLKLKIQKFVNIGTLALPY